MSVFFRLHQDKSVGTKRSGKWYARMVPMGVIDTRRLAEIVQRNCTVKKSDVLAVISELVETMRDQMQDGKRVKLDGFGSFKIGPRRSQCQGVQRGREHRWCPRGVQPRAQHRRCRQPHQAVPAGRTAGRAA